MASHRLLRAAASATLATVGLVLSLIAGAPLAAALLALLCGAAAIALAAPMLAGETSSGEASGEPSAPPEPAVTELLSAIDQPLLLVRNRRVVAANSAARRLLGDHVEGVDVRLAIRHPAAAEPLSERQPDGERIIRTDLTGLGDRDSRWEMTASLMADGSRLVHLQDRSDSDASERMRTDFVANASHELRTPLATLLGFLETLQDEEAAEDKKTRSRFLQIMFDEARRMHRLVDDLISLSRIEAERFTLPREAVSLLPLIEEARSSCTRLMEDRASAIEVEEGILEPVVLGDRSQLLQLIQNLVVNALKYGRSGTPVRIRFRETGDMLRISVIDSGEGIEPEHLPRLTERFYRADPSRSRSMGGTGLGLAIVKHIVGRHRGRLDIRSKVGEGTAVHVFLPRVPMPLSLKSHESVTEVTRADASGMKDPDPGLDGG